MANTWLNANENLNTSMLEDQLKIGELLIYRFRKQEDYHSVMLINFELNQIIKIIYERRRISKTASN